MHTTKIAIIVFPGFNLLATTAFIDPFRALNYLQSKALYEWQFICRDGEKLWASNGMAVTPDLCLKDASQQYDMVMVSSSWLPEEHNHKDVNRFLQHHHRRGAIIGGLDTGAQILAYAGLLRQRRASIHYEHIATMRELFADTTTTEELFVIDERIATCCGGSAAADLALSFMRDHYGVDMANSAARYIFHDRLRSPNDSQLPVHYEPVGHSVPGPLRQAIVIMESHLENTLSIADVATRTGVSQRQLERLFKHNTGISPIQYYLEVRLDRAHGIITQTQLPILSVAVACGFNSQEHFSKAYKKRFGNSPSEDRRLGRTPFHFRSFPAPHREHH